MPLSRLGGLSRRLGGLAVSARVGNSGRGASAPAISAAVGQVVETSTAQSITRRQLRTVAQVTGTDTAQAITLSGGEVNVGTLVVDGGATPEQLALFLPLTGTVATTATAACQYRVQGAGSWTPGHPLYRIRTGFAPTPGEGGAIEDGFAWTIIDLLPNTTYEVEVTVTEGSNQSTRNLTATTRALPAAAGAATVNVSAGSTAAQIASAINGAAAGAVIVLANGTYNLSGDIGITSGGSSGNTKYVRGASRDGVILARSTIGRFFSLDAALTDLVIENMTIQGNGVDAGPSAGAYTEVLGTNSSSDIHTRVTLRNITATGIDRATYLYNERQLLVYDNSFTGINLWNSTFLDSNATWDDDGFAVSGIGNCVFNNFLKGFGDSCSCVQDNGTNGRSLHFYRNDIRNGGDDCLEVDDGRRNITFYDNRIHNVMTFVSLDPIYAGPLLIARNIIVNVGEVSTFKIKDDSSGYFIYNNTFIATVRSYRSDPTAAFWYTFLQQRSFALRNNIIIDRGGDKQYLLWWSNAALNPADITHNAYFPATGTEGFADLGSVGTYATLAATQSGVANSTPVFGSFHSPNNRRFNSDVTTVTDPFTASTALGANSAAEVTATYTPALSGGSAPKNSGVAIPNITDGYTGAAPDLGAVIEGRNVPFYGDRSLVPAWVSALSVGQWTSIANTRWDSVQFTPVPPGNGPQMKCDAWNSLVVDPATSRVYNVAAGGHNDYAGNEVEYLDLNKATPNWVRALDPSPTSEYANPGNGASYYDDDRPCSRHSYYGITYSPSNRRIYLLGGAHWNNSGGFHNAISSYNLDTNAYSASTAHGSWNVGGTPVAACCFDPANGNVYVLNDFRVSRWNPGTNTWTTDLNATGVTPDQANECCCAFDSTRGRAFFLGGSAASAQTYTVGTNVMANVTLSGSASGSVKGNERGMVYVPEIDAYLVRAGGSGQTVYRINASTFECTTFSTSGGTPPATANGPYNKFLYVPALRGCVYVPEYDGNAWFLRVH